MFLNIGNLGSNVATEDLIQLFDLGTTSFLQPTCSVELATCEKTEHVHSELMKLNGIEFYGRQVVIEEAKPKPDSEKENKENKEKRKARNPKGNTGRGRGRGGGGNRRWGPRPKNKFNLPTLEPDQVFHLVDCGVNLTNPK